MKALIKKRIIAYSLMQICLLFVLLGLSGETHAENYYALNAFRIEAKSGNIYEMAVVTKVHDLGTCQKIGKEKGQPIGRWESVSTECIHGSDEIMDGTTYNQWFKSTFDNKPLPELYISFTDLNGYETRINFMGLPIAASAPLAATLVNSFEMQGIKNAKIIYPKE